MKCTVHLHLYVTVRILTKCHEDCLYNKMYLSSIFNSMHFFVALYGVLEEVQ